MQSPLLRYLAWREARHPDPVVAEHRRRLLAGLEGTVVEVGCGEGANFAHYPSRVRSVLAVEPDAHARAVAEEAAAAAPVPVTVVAGVAEALPAEDDAFDAGVCCWVLCTVEDPARALAELRRAIRPGGELRVYEHVRAADGPLALVQRVSDATWWPPLVGGCHTTRDTEAEIERAGFAFERLERFRHSSSWVTRPAAPNILGVARVP